MVGTRLSHYTILERLGSGGMGVVYRAHDDRLERDVALKVLPEGSLDAPEARRRFQREALAASRVIHPNVGTVFEFDSEAGADFLVMELVPGESLERRLSRSPLPTNEILRYGIQIAGAVASLHESGVLHCDLKPANVVITPAGQAKVLDFGLARSLRTMAPGSGTATTVDAGRLIGTPAYMAPEQVDGRPLDGRTDVYAMGATLYAMATGSPPHVENDFTALLYAVVNRRPAPPGGRRPDLPDDLVAIIMKSLEKSPDHRFASAADLVRALTELERSSSGSRASSSSDLRSPLAGAPFLTRPAPGSDRARVTIESLVVLPLTNLSADPEQEFFADGMTEALIATLSRIRALRVISRTSAMLYKGVRKPLPEIARELNVDAVVEGSVARAGDRVRITASLVDAHTDQSLWSQSYEHRSEDVLALQSEAAMAIAEEIQIQLTPAEAARLVVKRGVPAEAYEAYLRGRELWNRRTVTDVRHALALFDQAVRVAPELAPAHAGIADAYNILGDLGAILMEESRSKAIAAANRALEIDPDLAEAHTSLGFVLFFAWDWDTAEAEFQRALATQPSYATAHQWYAELLTALGRFEQAELEARRALELDPHSLVIRTSLADLLYFARRYDESRAILQETLALDHHFLAAMTDLARLQTQTGHVDEAIVLYERAATLLERDPLTFAPLAHAYAVAGRHTDARRVLERVEPLAREGRVRVNAITVVYAALGDLDSAFAWLERGIAVRDRAMVWNRVHPRLDVLRGDPRFDRVLRAMKLV